MLLGMITDGLFGTQGAATISIELDEVEVEITDEYSLEIDVEES